MEPRRGVKTAAGLFVFAGLVLLAASILLLGQRGRYFTPQHTLETWFTDVEGLSKGAPVRLAGVAVGWVSRITLPTAPERKVRVTLSIAEDAMANIRQDSVARVETRGFLGDKFVAISVGSAEAPPLPDGGTLETEASMDFGALVGQGRRVLGNTERLTAALSEGDGVLPWLVNDPESRRLVRDTLGAARSITASVEQGRGALGWLARDPESKRLLAETLRSVHAVTASAQRGEGAVSWLLQDPDSRRLVQDLGRTAEILAALAREVQDGRGLAHALIYDPKGGEMLAEAAAALGEIRSLTTAVREGDGALPALLFDPESRQLLESVTKAAQNLEQATGKLARGEGTIGALLDDPTVYESLVALLDGAQRSRLLRWAMRRTIESGHAAKADAAKGEAAGSPTRGR